MVISRRGHRLLRTGVLAFVLGLVAAPGAFAAADTVTLTRFSKAVSGTESGPPTGSVTVDLLRNTVDLNGVPVRQQVDSFTTSVSGGSWSGAFAKHAFSTNGDQVEINYIGVAGQDRVTIGGGTFLPSASVPGTSHTVDMPADDLDGQIGISGDGHALSVSCNDGCDTFTVPSADLPITNASGSFTFATARTNADTVLVTGTLTQTGTTVNLTDSAPLPNPLAPDVDPTSPNNAHQPACTFYLVTSEIVCFNLVPGSYTVTHLRGGATIATQPLTVPARPGATSSSIPTLGSAAFANVAAGDQLRLTLGPHTLSTLTVDPMTINTSSTFGDLQNGAPTIVTGICTAQVFFVNGDGLCAADGTIPAVTSLPSDSPFLSFVGSVGNDSGQLDDTSAGSTEIDSPSVVYSTPLSREEIHTPYIALALARYNDPAALAASQQGNPAVGSTPVVSSTPSNAAVSLSIAPLGSSTFRLLGNAAKPGGVVIPALAPGVYVARFMRTDSRGDVSSFDRSFVALPNPPTGPPPPKCSAKSTSGLKAGVAAKGNGRGPRRTSTITLTFSCRSSAATGHLALWLRRGSTTVAQGVASVRRHRATIKLQGNFPRGTYRLIEVVDAAGQATEATQILTLRR